MQFRCDPASACIRRTCVRSCLGLIAFFDGWNPDAGRKTSLILDDIILDNIDVHRCNMAQQVPRKVEIGVVTGLEPTNGASKRAGRYAQSKRTVNMGSALGLGSNVAAHAPCSRDATRLHDNGALTEKRTPVRGG